MFARQRSKEQVILTKKQFFIRWGVIDTVYCAFAWLVLAAVSMQTMSLYGNYSDSDLTKFTLTFIGCIAGLIGLIPNCGASVVLTQLYLEGALSFGAMMGGLLVGAGVGLLVLFLVRRDFRKNLCVAGLLYFIGVLAGVLLELTGVGNFI